MRTTVAILGLFLCVQTASAQIEPSCLTRGTIDKYNSSSITVNVDPRGVDTRTISDKCVCIIDGVTVKREDVKPGMKCVLYGLRPKFSNTFEVTEIRCFVKDTPPWIKTGR